MEVGTTYNLEVDLLIQNCNFVLVFGDSKDWGTVNATTVTVTPSSAWQTVSVTHTVGSEVDYTMFFVNPTSIGVAYVDNANLTIL